MLKYHQFRGRLGMGDLHPGGIRASDTLLGCLQAHDVRRVLEVGAGIGNTASRLLELGFEVTALEPDPVLFEQLHRRPGITARSESLFDHRCSRPYDAVIAESVFCMLDLPAALLCAKRLLRPGGFLCFVDAVWTAKVSPQQSQQWHENTLRLFGIPVGSRARLTWSDWCGQLRAAGFETLYAERLPRGSAGHPPSSNWRASARAIACEPRLLLWMARYRLRKRAARMPSGVLESWLYFGRSV